MEPALDEQLDRLAVAAEALAGEFELEGVLETITGTAAMVTGARYAALGVVGEDETITRFITHGVTEEQVRRIGHYPTGKGILGLLIRDPTVLRLDDLGRSPPQPLGDLSERQARRETAGDLHVPRGSGAARHGTGSSGGSHPTGGSVRWLLLGCLSWIGGPASLPSHRPRSGLRTPESLRLSGCRSSVTSVGSRNPPLFDELLRSPTERAGLDERCRPVLRAIYEQSFRGWSLVDGDARLTAYVAPSVAQLIAMGKRPRIVPCRGQRRTTTVLHDLDRVAVPLEVGVLASI